MGRKEDAIGFAVYIDLLERLDTAVPEFDADVLITYTKKTSFGAIFKTIDECRKNNLTFSVRSFVPEDGRYGKVISLDEEA